MITKSAVAKLTDFGISKSIKEQLSKSKTTLDSSGTLCYMAPEQLRNQVCDRRTDVYAIGIMSHLLLTGEFPFAIDNPKAVVAWHVGPDQEFPLLPVEWRNIISKCLIKNANQRYTSCREFETAIEQMSTSASEDLFGEELGTPEVQFRSAVRTALADSILTAEEKKKLNALMQELGLSIEVAKKLIAEEHARKKNGGEEVESSNVSDSPYKPGDAFKHRKKFIDAVTIVEPKIDQFIGTMQFASASGMGMLVGNIKPTVDIIKKEMLPFLNLMRRSASSLKAGKLTRQFRLIHQRRTI